MVRTPHRLALALATTAALLGQATTVYAAPVTAPAPGNPNGFTPSSQDSIPRSNQSADRKLPSYQTWISDVSDVLDEAAEYLQDRLSDVDNGENPAVVLDIDNTALESSYSPGRITPAIPPSLEVALKAVENGATVFFITARPESNQATTEHNLDSVGYAYEGVYLRSAYDRSSLQTYKTNSRIDIEERGYTIVANIGNNTTDLAGGHAERTFKLPDYNGLLP